MHFLCNYIKNTGQRRLYLGPVAEQVTAGPGPEAECMLKRTQATVSLAQPFTIIAMVSCVIHECNNNSNKTPVFMPSLMSANMKGKKMRCQRPVAS